MATVEHGISTAAWAFLLGQRENRIALVEESQTEATANRLV